MFLGSLISIVNASNNRKCVLLSNQKCMTLPTLSNLHSSSYSHKFPYCLFAVKLDKCVTRCNNLNDLSNKSCVPNKTDLNLSVFNMTAEIEESKTLTKRISRECKCRFDRRKCNWDQWWKNDKCRYESKKILCRWRKVMFRVLLHVFVKIENI